jgi:hypothetical protein
LKRLEVSVIEARIVATRLESLMRAGMGRISTEPEEDVGTYSRAAAHGGRGTGSPARGDGAAPFGRELARFGQAHRHIEDSSASEDQVLRAPQPSHNFRLVSGARRLAGA